MNVSAFDDTKTVPILPETPNEPDIWTAWRNGFTNDAVNAFDAVIAYDDVNWFTIPCVTAKEPVIPTDPVNVWVFVSNEPKRLEPLA